MLESTGILTFSTRAQRNTKHANNERQQELGKRKNGKATRGSSFLSFFSHSISVFHTCIQWETFKNPTHRRQISHEREKHFFGINVQTNIPLYSLFICIVCMDQVYFFYSLHLFWHNPTTVHISAVWLLLFAGPLNECWFTLCASFSPLTGLRCACILSKVLQIFDDKMTRICFRYHSNTICRQSKRHHSFDAVSFSPPSSPLFYFSFEYTRSLDLWACLSTIWNVFALNQKPNIYFWFQENSYSSEFSSYGLDCHCSRYVISMKNQRENGKQKQKYEWSLCTSLYCVCVSFFFTRRWLTI